MRKLFLLLLACVFCSTGATLKAQVARLQARDAEWKSYSLPATNFTRQITADKSIVFRVPADWKQDEGSELTFRGPHGSTLMVAVRKVPDGYPLLDYVATILKEVRDRTGSADNLTTRRTQFQDLEAREILFEKLTDSETTFRSAMWVTISGPTVVVANVQTSTTHAAEIEPLFKATVQSVRFATPNYSEFETLRSGAIKTPAPAPINELENIVDTLTQLNADRESAISRLTPLFVSQPDAAVDLLLDRRVAVRSAAVEALARSKNVALKPFLWHVIDDPDPFVAEPAAKRIAEQPDVITHVLSKSTSKNKSETIARIWPFLSKQNQIKFLETVLNETNAKDSILQLGAVTLAGTTKLEEFKLPFTRILAANNNLLTSAALAVAMGRRESLPVNELFKLAASPDKQIRSLAVQNLSYSAATSDITQVEALLSKGPSSDAKEEASRKEFDEQIKLAVKKIRFREDLNLAKSLEEQRAKIRKASSDPDLADFAWRFDCESTTAGCPSPARAVPQDFKVKSFAENLFPKQVRHYAAIPNPAQTVQRFYETLHGLQLNSPRAQANLILVMGNIRQKLGQELGAPPDAALIDYTGIQPDSPFVVGSWTATGAPDTSSAQRRAIVVRVKDPERFARAVESFQQATGRFMGLTDYIGAGTRAIAVLPAILPISAQAVLAAGVDKPETKPELKYSFIGKWEWNGIPMKTIVNLSMDSNSNVQVASTYLTFIGDVAILTEDIATLRELLTNATAAEPQLLAANEEFRRAVERDGDVVYFSDLKKMFADPADTASTEKANESGALKFVNSTWENSHRIVFNESEWSKPLVPFHPKELSSPSELLPSSTIAYYMMRLDVPGALETWPKTMNLRNRFETELSLFALDFKKEVAPELGPECGVALLEMPDLYLSKDDVMWAAFCRLKSNKLSDALTAGKLFRNVGPTTTFAEVKSGDTSYFVASKNGFFVVSNNSKGITALADKKSLASTRDYSRAVEKVPAGIVAFGGYNLEAAVNAASANTAEGLRATAAAMIFSVASAFHSQSFYATASPGAIEGRSSVAMDREGLYAVADFPYLSRGSNITFATLEPHGTPIINQTRISNMVLKVRAKAPGPIDSIRDDIKTATQTVEQKSPNELIVTVAARRSNGDKQMQLPVTDPALAPFLKSTGEFAADDKAVIEQAKQIAGDDRDAWSVARKLADWTHNNLVWKSVARAGAAETLATREADCSEFSQLFVAMARSLGLPARIVSGLAYSGNTFGGHAWVEVWVGEWVELDPTWGTNFVDATHIRNNDSALITAAALNLIDLEVIETRRTVAEFQKSPQALAEHLVKVIPAANKPEIEDAIDLPVLTDELMGQGSWNKLNEHERDQMSSGYRRVVQEISGFAKDGLAEDLRLMHVEEKGDRAVASSLWVSEDIWLKLQFVRRENAWHLLEIVQADTGLEIVSGTIGPTVKAIEENRAGKKTVAGPFSEFVETVSLINSDVEKGLAAVDRQLKAKPGDQNLRLLRTLALF
ncbi:MAG TPA: transglutaminase domain-containing protein, partial [Pyrinomonadaceae bacterium]|nr:transglutaminase domain-containing protein [Pyrinomonadaceae bacterium]